LNGATTAGVGGGIRNAGTLTLSFTTLSGNTALNNNGGGIYNTGRTLLIHTLIMANATQGSIGNRDGGGIYNDGALALSQSQVTGNVAVRNGGGIYTTPTHLTRIIQSTISGDTAANLGGGLYNEGTTVLRASVVKLNEAVGKSAAGGGIFNSAGNVILSHSVVSKNSPDNCDPANSVPGCTG
jgi:hypothetical protein